MCSNNKVKKVVINTCCDVRGGVYLSDAAVDWMRAKGDQRDIVDDEGCCLLDREDEMLVACVETLGDKANGRDAALEIEETSFDAYLVVPFFGGEMIFEKEEPHAPEMLYTFADYKYAYQEWLLRPEPKGPLEIPIK